MEVDQIGHLLVYIVEEWIIECAVLRGSYQCDTGYSEKEAEETEYDPRAGEDGRYASGRGVPRRPDAYHISSLDTCKVRRNIYQRFFHGSCFIIYVQYTK